MPLLGSVAVTTVATATGRLTGTVAVTTGAVSTVTGTDGLTGDVAARGLSGWVGVRIASSVTGRVVVSTAGAATTAVGEATVVGTRTVAMKRNSPPRTLERCAFLGITLLAAINKIS